MPAPLTDKWFDEQLELCEEATKGPWTTYPNRRKRPYEEDEVGPWVIECGHDLPGFPCLGAFESEANAEFIAAARESYPLVLRELLAAREVIAKLTGQLGKARLRLGTELDADGLMEAMIGEDWEEQVFGKAVDANTD